MAASFVSTSQVTQFKKDLLYSEHKRQRKRDNLNGRRRISNDMLQYAIAYTIDPSHPPGDQSVETYGSMSAMAPQTLSSPFGIYGYSLEVACPRRNMNIGDTTSSTGLLGLRRLFTQQSPDRSDSKTVSKPLGAGFRAHSLVAEDRQHLPGFTFQIECTWSDSILGFQRHIATMTYHHGNIERPAPGQDLDTVLSFRKITCLDDISSIDNYPDIDIGRLEDSIRANCFELQIKCKGWHDDRHCSGFRMYANDEAYGPLIDNIRNIRQRLEGDHTVRVLLFDTFFPERYTKCIAGIEASWISHPLLKWFRCQDGEPSIDSETVLADHERPQYSVQERLTYADVPELLAVEIFAKLFDHEWEDCAARQKVELKARFVRYVDQPRHPIMAYLDTTTAELQASGSIHEIQDEDNRPSVRDTLTSMTDSARVFMIIHPRNSNDHSSLSISGTVIPNPNPADSKHILVKLAETPVPEDGDVHSSALDMIEPLIVNIEDSANDRSAQAHRRSAPSSTVTVAMVADEKSYQRVLYAGHTIVPSARLVEHGLKTDPLDRVLALRCVRFDRLPRLNLFDCVASSLLDSLRHGPFVGREDLQAGIDVFKHAPGGIVLMHGQAGCGKSHAVLEYLHVLWQQHVLEPEYDCKVLLASPLNNNADSMALKLAAKTASTGKPMDVIRLFAPSAEFQIVQTALPQSSRAGRDHRKGTADEFDGTILRSRGHVAEMMRHIQEHTGHLPGITDQRVETRTLKKSLGWHVLEACGILDNTRIVTNPVYRRFADAHAMMSDMLASRARRHPGANAMQLMLNEAVDANIRRQYSAAWRDASHERIRHADAVVTTLALATEERVLDNFVPTIITIEEASKAETLPVSLLLLVYPETPFIMLGDILQIAPQSKAPSSYNAFADQVPITLFARLYICGLPHLHVRLNERFSPGLCSFLSEVFCGGGLQLSPRKLAIEGMAGVQDSIDRVINAVGGPRNFAGKRVLGVQVNNTRESYGRNKTRFNLKMAIAAWQTFERSVAVEGYLPQDFAMITNYRGERALLNRIRHSRISDLKAQGMLFHGHDPDTLLKLLIQTPDKCQGGERNFVIYDTTITTTLGSMRESKRVFTGLTRACKAVFFLLDYEALNRCGAFDARGRHSIVYEIWTKLGETGAICDYRPDRRLAAQYAFVERMSSAMVDEDAFDVTYTEL